MSGGSEMKFKENKKVEAKEKKYQKEGNKAYIKHEEEEVKEAKKHEGKKMDGKSHKGKDGKKHDGAKAGCKRCK